MSSTRRPRHFERTFDLDDEHVSLMEEAHQFAAEVLRPVSLELDNLPPSEVIAAGSPLWPAMRKWYQAGHHLMMLPESVGGADLDPLARTLVQEELGWGASDLAVSFGVAALPFFFAAHIGTMLGNTTLINEIVKPFVEDTEAKMIGCWAITEPTHGSDELGAGTEAFASTGSAGSCRAYQKGDEWVITGQKSAWVSNGTIATHALLFCTVDAEKGMGGGGVAIVPLDLPGVSKGPPLDKLGQRALNQGEIFFDEVHLPAELMMIGPDFYRDLLDITLVTANTGMSLLFTGVARAAFEEALDYAGQRVQGGKVIAEHQMIQTKLFNMYVKVEQARAMARGMLLQNSQAPAVARAIAAKVAGTEAALSVANDAVQIFGGMGLAKGTLVEKLYRDARASTIEDGVNEFLGLVAARHLVDSYGEAGFSMDLSFG